MESGRAALGGSVVWWDFRRGRWEGWLFGDGFDGGEYDAVAEVEYRVDPFSMRVQS